MKLKKSRDYILFDIMEVVVLGKLGLRQLHGDVKPGGCYWKLTRPYAPGIPDFVRETIWAVLHRHLPQGYRLKAVTICAINDMIGGCPPSIVSVLQDCARKSDANHVDWVTRLQSTTSWWVNVVTVEAARVERVLRCWKAALGDFLVKMFPQGIDEVQRPMVLTDLPRALKHLRTAPVSSVSSTGEWTPSKGWPDGLQADRVELWYRDVVASVAAADVAAATGESGAPQVVAVSASSGGDDRLRWPRSAWDRLKGRRAASGAETVPAAASMEPTPTTGRSSVGIVSETPL